MVLPFGLCYSCVSRVVGTLPSATGCFVRFNDGMNTRTVDSIDVLECLDIHPEFRIDLHPRLAEAANRTLSNAKNVFTSINHSTGVYVRNTNLWLDVDLSCWPVRNVTQNTSRYLGCLVTRKHLIQAWHARSAVGSTLRFVSPENEIVERKIVSSVKVGDVDLHLVTLDEEVPENITPCQVFPREVEDCIKYVDLPIIAGDQETKLLSKTATYYGKTSEEGVQVGAFIMHYPSEDPEYIAVTEGIIPGDSGSPLWMVLNGKLVAMGAHSISLSLTCISYVVDKINTMMAGQTGGE